MEPNKYIRLSSETKHLTAFFFWGAWACGAARPGKTYSYTLNWPYDPLAGNVMTTSAQMWSIAANFGLIMLLGKLLYAFGRR